MKLLLITYQKDDTLNQREAQGFFGFFLSFILNISLEESNLERRRGVCGTFAGFSLDV